jgi:hypothetical protein
MTKSFCYIQKISLLVKKEDFHPTKGRELLGQSPSAPEDTKISSFFETLILQMKQ